MEILSQKEIDDLLRALSTGEVKLEDLNEPSEEVSYKSYDFRRPNKSPKNSCVIYRLCIVFLRVSCLTI